jgi:diguanylate cyclase
VNGTTWRGWTAGSTTSDEVQSTRLPAEAAVQNRFFPKVRSWFALGAPLELLSPLSLLRVLYLVAAVGWALVGGGPHWTGAHGVAVAMVSLVAAGVTYLLLRARSVDMRATEALIALWIVLVSVLAWSGAGSGLSFVAPFFFLPICAFAAMFFPLRFVVATTALATLGTLCALLPATTVGQGIAAAAALAFSALAVSLTVAVLVRSTQRSGIVDPDTGLPNGFGLARELVGRRSSRSFVVAVISFDGLGTAREALGYQVGTELLRRAVEDLGQVLPKGAVIGRVESDELVVAYGVDGIDDVDDVDDAHATSEVPAEMLRAAETLVATLSSAAITGRYEVRGLEVSLGAHVGLALCPWDGTDVAELIRRASISARRAAAHRLVSARWSGDEGVMTARDLAMVSGLREAGRRGELWVAYQPQVDATGRTVAVEALLRWDSLQHGAVPPGTFIPLAERTGLIDRITEWVVLEVLDAQARWRELGVRIPASVNLSAKNLTRTDLPDWILSELAARSLPPDCLVLEVTETAAAVDLVLAIDVLRPLHDRGVRISIDDFGVGYTSLSILPRLPLDELKVDQSFVLSSPTSPPALAIVHSVRALAHQLGLTVVAEGVETEEIRALMVDAGFDLLQGYLFARPMGEVELLEHLRVRAAVR